MQNPRKTHWEALIQVFRYLKAISTLGLTYKHQNGNTLQGWCDADYNGDKDTRHSTSGSMFSL
jgi:hypothetical protein